MEVQIFGVRKCADTRKTLRFFAKYRVKTHFVDLDEQTAVLGKVRRFAQKFGIGLLIDSGSRRFAELGLRSVRLPDERWLTKLADELLLLRTPLVRNANQLTIGLAEEEWRSWITTIKSSS